MTAFFCVACGGSGSAPSSPGPVAVAPSAPEGDSNSGNEETSIVQRGIEYALGQTEGGSKSLQLDIYQPSGNCISYRPTILFIHGGGFVGGSRTSEAITRHANAALDEQFNFVSMSYRLAGDNPLLSTPYRPIAEQVNASSFNTETEIINAAIAALEDSAAAIDWMDQNASDYCLNMSRFALWGSSAGAFTVLNAAYSLDNFNITLAAEPDVVINYWGNLLFDAHLDFMEAPFITVHGDADRTVPYQGALNLAMRADEVGVPYAFYTEVGGGHGVGPGETVDDTTILELTMDFLEAHLVGGVANYETANIDP
ncbi:MAG: alpha/beta hydrolase [Pseudomonadota bacterium]